jgi:hypothetical protein
MSGTALNPSLNHDRGATLEQSVKESPLMDVVTQSLLKEFVASQKIEGLGQADQFEAFVNYIVVSDIFPEEFDFGMISTGKGEFGLDGIAVIVNDILVDDEEQLEDIVAHSPSLQVQFVFIQSKTSPTFDAGDMSKFFQAVMDFFRPWCEFIQSDKVVELQRVKNNLYESAAKFVRGLPLLNLYYATTGTWSDDKNLCTIRDGFLAQLGCAAHVRQHQLSPFRCREGPEALFPD